MTKQILLLAIVVLLTLTITHTTNGARDFLTRIRGKNLYAIKEQWLNWSDADSICRREFQGKLVSVLSASENTALLNTIRARYGPGGVRSFFIGLTKKNYHTYRDPAGYAWMDSSPVNYMNWANNEPNYYYHMCTEMYSDGNGWNDISCGDSRSDAIGLCHAENDCGWENGVDNFFGAPKPTVSISWSNDNLQFQVTMKNHPRKKVTHFISFEPIPTDYPVADESITIEHSTPMEIPEESAKFEFHDLFSSSQTTKDSRSSEEAAHITSIVTAGYHNYASTDTLVEKTSCNSKYSIDLSWASPYISREYDIANNQIVLKATMYAYYILVDSSSKQVKKVLYPFEQVLNAKLTSDTVRVFDTQQLEILKFSLIELSQVKVKSGGSQASLQLIASLTCNQKFQVADVSFVSSTEPLLRLKDVALSQMSTTSYEINMLTQPFYDREVSSLATTYVIRANVTESNTGATLRYDIPFKIYYDIVTPSPAINITFASEIVLKDGVEGSQKSMFKYGESAYVETISATTGELYDNMQLTIRNAYVCCSHDSNINTLKTNGCTAYNPSTMSQWYHLVKNGIPNSFSTIHGTSRSDRTLFSFKVNNLVTDANRICLVQVNSLLKRSSSSRSLLSTLNREESDEEVQGESNTFSELRFVPEGSEESVSSADSLTSKKTSWLGMVAGWAMVVIFFM